MKIVAEKFWAVQRMGVRRRAGPAKEGVGPNQPDGLCFERG